jgi:single-strand DNA-binding protein
VSSALVVVVGHLGGDPEVKAIESTGEVYTQFSVAVTTSRRDGKHTDWFRCAAFGKTGSNVAEYLRKGSQCQVVGSLTSSSWKDRDGNHRHTLEVKANQVTFVGSRSTTSTEPPATATAKSSPQPYEEDDLPF